MSNSIDRTSMKQSLNIEYLALKHMDRANEAFMTGDENLIRKCLRSLVSILPPENRKNILSRENEYKYTVTTWTTPINMPTLSANPLAPVVINKKTDLNYDSTVVGTRYYLIENGDPNEAADWESITELGGETWISPTQNIVANYDLEVFYDIIHEEYMGLGLTWKIRPRSVVRPKDNINDLEHLQRHPLYLPTDLDVEAS